MFGFFTRFSSMDSFFFPTSTESKFSLVIIDGHFGVFLVGWYNARDNDHVFVSKDSKRRGGDPVNHTTNSRKVRVKTHPYELEVELFLQNVGNNFGRHPRVWKTFVH